MAAMKKEQAEGRTSEYCKFMVRENALGRKLERALAVHKEAYRQQVPSSTWPKHHHEDDQDEAAHHHEDG